MKKNKKGKQEIVFEESFEEAFAKLPPFPEDAATKPVFEKTFEEAFAELPPSPFPEKDDDEEDSVIKADTPPTQSWKEYQMKAGSRPPRQGVSSFLVFLLTVLFTLVVLLSAILVGHLNGFFDLPDNGDESAASMSAASSFSEPAVEVQQEPAASSESVATASSSEPEEEPEQVRPLSDSTYVYGALHDAAENAKYATVYAPDYDIEAPLYFGDTAEILVGPNIGQSTLTYQIGYQTAHLLCTYDPEIVAGMYRMALGSKFQIETSYGTYLYVVTGIDHGTVDESTGYIVSASGQQLIALTSENDVVFLYTDYPANAHTNEKYVIRAALCV